MENEMTFSQRMKLKPVREILQINSLDQETRNALWNIIYPFLEKMQSNSTINNDIWTELYHKAIDDEINTRQIHDAFDIHHDVLFYRFFRRKICEENWNECFDLIEFIVNEQKKWLEQFSEANRYSIQPQGLSQEEFNSLFEKYMVGYRFVNGEITPITNSNEIQAIEDATKKTGPSVKEQLAKALEFLSNRSNPDYAKSVQCSICAVEAQCCILLGSNATLGQALRQMAKKGIKLHTALKDAFEKLYGYASDTDGIRHGGITPSAVDQDLAKFMLVTCSAFINYLISKNT